MLFKTLSGDIEVDLEKKVAYFFYQDFECPLTSRSMDNCGKITVYTFQDMFGAQFSISILFDGVYLDKLDWKTIGVYHDSRKS